MFWFREGATTRLYMTINNSGFLTVAFHDGSGNWSTNGFASGNTTPISASVWYHIAWVYDGDTTKTFVDGVLDRTFSVGVRTTSGSLSLRIGENWVGHIDDIRITRAALYTAAFTPPTQAFIEGDPTPEGIIAAAGPLGIPSVVGNVVVVNGYVADSGPLKAPSVRGGLAYDARVAVASPLGTALIDGLHDFSAAIPAGTPSRYLCDLFTPAGTVRVPISSWQATLQVGQSDYVQAVIPACGDYVAALEAATEFAISRAVTLDDGMEIEYEMARSDLEQLSLARGARRYTATISGYGDPQAIDPDADNPARARTLQGVQTLTVQGGYARVRCAIDWLIRPGNFATADGRVIVADYINLYVSDGQAFMDVGERA